MSENHPGAAESLPPHARGNTEAASRLLPLVYDELRALAARYMQRERRDHTLQPTALVHEAYVRLIDGARVEWHGKTHFYALAATQMRRILIEHARARMAGKQISFFIKKGDIRNGAVSVYCLTDKLAMDRAFGKTVPVVEVGFNFSRQGLFPQAVHPPQNGKLQPSVYRRHVCFPKGAGPVHSIRS